MGIIIVTNHIKFNSTQNNFVSELFEMEASPVMWRNNCGFYANSNEENLCSMCYKDLLKKMQNSTTPSERSSVNVVEKVTKARNEIETGSDKADVASKSTALGEPSSSNACEEAMQPSIDNATIAKEAAPDK